MTEAGKFSKTLCIVKHCPATVNTQAAVSIGPSFACRTFRAEARHGIPPSPHTCIVKT